MAQLLRHRGRYDDLWLCVLERNSSTLQRAEQGRQYTHPHNEFCYCYMNTNHQRSCLCSPELWQCSGKAAGLTPSKTCLFWAEGIQRIVPWQTRRRYEQSQQSRPDPCTRSAASCATVCIIIKRRLHLHWTVYQRWAIANHENNFQLLSNLPAAFLTTFISCADILYLRNLWLETGSQMH